MAEPIQTDGMSPRELADWLDSSFPRLLLDGDDRLAFPLAVRMLREDHPEPWVVRRGREFARRAAQVGGLWSSGNHMEAFDLIPPNARLPWLLSHRAGLTIAELEPLLLRAWTDPELIVGGTNLPYDALVALFERVCGQEPPITLTDDPERCREFLASPPVLYRGDDPVHRPSSEPWDGLSWTESLEEAIRFAKRSSGRVWTLDLAEYPGVPFAVICSGGPFEVLLDPSRCPERVWEVTG